MLWNYRNIGLIHSLMPNAHIIHISRDPMDTLLSCSKNRFVGPPTAWSMVTTTCYHMYYKSVFQIIFSQFAVQDDSLLVKQYSQYLQVKILHIVDSFFSDLKEALLFILT